jgi:extracellular elastinolytic metalloproteinase
MRRILLWYDSSRRPHSSKETAMTLRRRVGSLTSVTALIALTCVAPQVADAAPAAPTPAGPARGSTDRVWDVRQSLSAQADAVLNNRVARMNASTAVRSLHSALGSQSVVDIDKTTLTPRFVGRLNGYLTSRSAASPAAASPATIAMNYVAAHPGVFRLTAADLTHFKLARDYVDISGVSHLSWVQTVNGVPLFDNGIKANVAKDGRLINVQGSPVPGLSAPAVTAKLSASDAIAAAKGNAGAKNRAATRNDHASEVVFATSGGARPAYQVVAMSLADPALYVVDSASGRILFRESLRSDEADPDTTDETASVFQYYPGAAVGGTQQPVDLTTPGWLPAGSTTLTGNNAHTYSDVNDDNTANPAEEVHPNAAGTYIFPLVRVKHIGNEPCQTHVCTWRPNTPFSWETNRAQTSTQNFFFINKYHDHLEAAPIGFTEAAGNFQQVNTSGSGVGGDPVLDEPLDGANTANGLPDGGHIDNANFDTPPDGVSPRMQMYLFHQPFAGYPNGDPFIASAGSDEADIVYHEYTHGLSHRLVVNANNVPALDSQQGASMGEAWSDWYAADFLVNQGYETDTSAPGEIGTGAYVFGGLSNTIRSEPADCPVGAPATVCPGTAAAGPGGYTYGDFGKISRRGAEVHADGEIWLQTLWDLRTAVGSTLSESLVTRGMELSPTFPSFLDMRNAIIQADVVDHGGADVTLLWKIFAHRGMGFFAGTITGNDVHPVEDFSVPPTPGSPTATVVGRVRDSASGAGVPGAVVAFGGHDSGFPGDYTAVTNAQGRYRIQHVFPGTYPDVYAAGAGYNAQVHTVIVSLPKAFANFTVQRDWAAASGGASIAATNGDDAAPFGCGAAALIDQALTNGWSTAKPASGGRFATIKLPAAVNIATLQIDPSGTCGDDLVASAGDYTVETSKDGTTFATAASGTFSTSDPGHLVDIPLAAGTGDAVQYVRYTILSNQAAERGVTCPGGAEGCDWFDSQELEVFGTAAA